MERILSSVRSAAAGLTVRSMAGIHFEKYPDWWDVLLDGTVVGTVHLVSGGWAFYAAGRSRAHGHLPAGIGGSRDAAVRVGLTAGGSSAPGRGRGTPAAVDTTSD